MTIYYINADSGDDGTGDGSSGNPWETLAHAITNSAANDTITCQDATASYSFINQSIVDRTIEGETQGEVVFDGAGGDVGWNLAGTITMENIIFQNITITTTAKAVLERHNTIAIVLTLENCIFKEIQVVTITGHGGIVGTHQGGSGADSITITACLFNDIVQIDASSNGAIVAWRHSGPTTLSFNNCVVYCKTSGTTQLETILFFTGVSMTLELKNNIISNETGGTVNFGFGVATITNNCFYNITGVPAGTGNITLDPFFVDSQNSNFNLRPASPCVDTGVLI